MDVGQISLCLYISLLVILFSSFCTATSEPDTLCAHNGINYDGRCFWFIETKASWADANILCSRRFGDHVTLTTVKDDDTNSFIRQQSVATIWIGLHEGHGEGIWRWVDHSAPSGGHAYINWESSSPAKGSLTKNCAAMYRGGSRWRDVGCKKKYKFVCSELPSAPICSNGGTFFRDRCYWAAELSLPWEEANTHCMEHFGNSTFLTTAKDAELNLFLSRLIYPGIWLGLHDIHWENHWRWVDQSLLEYTNWRPGEPNNVNEEDCAVLHYDDATWNDQPCGGNNSIPNANRFICAESFCDEIFSEPNSGMSIIDYDESEVYDNVICLTTICGDHCAYGGTCNKTGTCICVKQFPHMVCDIADWQVNIEPRVVNAKTGGSFSMICKHNFPPENIGLLEWFTIGREALYEERTIIHNVFHKGYSMLRVTDIQYSDAQEYACRAVVTGISPYRELVSTAVVTVTEVTTQENIPSTLVTTAPRTYDSTTPPITTAILQTTPSDHTESDKDNSMTPRITTLTMPTMTTELSDHTELRKDGSTTPPVTTPTLPTEPLDHQRFTTSITGDDINISTESRELTDGKKPTTLKDNNNIPVTRSPRVTDVNKDPGNKNLNNHIDNKVNSEASKGVEEHTYNRGRGATATIVILAIMVTLLMIAVVGLMLKMRRLESDSFGASRLMEMNDRF